MWERKTGCWVLSYYGHAPTCISRLCIAMQKVYSHDCLSWWLSGGSHFLCTFNNLLWCSQPCKLITSTSLHFTAGCCPQSDPGPPGRGPSIPQASTELQPMQFCLHCWSSSALCSDHHNCSPSSLYTTRTAVVTEQYTASIRIRITVACLM